MTLHGRTTHLARRTTCATEIHKLVHTEVPLICDFVKVRPYVHGALFEPMRLTLRAQSPTAVALPMHFIFREEPAKHVPKLAIVVAQEEGCVYTVQGSST